MQSPDRWLACVGLGVVAGSLLRRDRPGFVAAVIAGSVFGVASRHSFLGPWIVSPPVFAQLRFLGPAACLLTGLLLMARGRWRSLSVPLVVFAVTAALLLVATINDPAPQGHAFVAGAALAATGLMLLAGSLRRWVDGTWVAVGERIAGSWLLTIGLLLSAAQLVPVPVPIEQAVHPREPARTLVVPGLDPILRPEPDSLAAPRRGDLQMGTN